MRKITHTLLLCLFFLFFFSILGFKGNKNHSGMETLRNIIKIIKSEYVEVKQEEELLNYSIRGMLQNIDPYSLYLSNKELNDIKIQSRGEFEGIGIEITIIDNMVKVISPIEGTPAYLAGIKPGDVITSINGVGLRGKNLSDVSELMRGKSGTKVKISIIRNFTTLEMEILRSQINVRSISTKEDKGIIYARISSFTEVTANHLKQELNKIIQRLDGNIKGIILDLRNNPGGLLEQAINVADFFLPEGKIIVSTINKNKNEVKHFYSSNALKLDTTSPMLVMINEGSASASEILAGTLKDNERALIIGKKSFGKASVQSIIPLENKIGAVKLTTAYYYTPSGKSIQGSGIMPDIEINNKVIEASTKQSNTQDLQLEKAFEILYAFNVFDKIKKTNRK